VAQIFFLDWQNKQQSECDFPRQYVIFPVGGAVYYLINNVLIAIYCYHSFIGLSIKYDNQPRYGSFKHDSAQYR
jgi:hypothetical protein